MSEEEFTSKSGKRLQVSDDALEEMIFKYGRDYTDLARRDVFDPITGRDREIEQTILILLQKGRKNVILLAPAGVGKTALFAGLAQTVVRGDVPEYLQNCRLIEIDLPSMAAGTSGPAEFQGRFIPMVKAFAERHELEEYPPFILFIDEVHTIMPMVEGSAYRGLSEVMKPYLTTGYLHVIGATTRDEHRMFVAQDPAMDRRFQKVHLSVPNIEETTLILRNLAPRFEKHFKIEIPDKLLSLIVRMTHEYMRRRNQPDKSIITLDGACAKYVMENGNQGTLDEASIYAAISGETGILAEALKEDKGRTYLVDEDEIEKDDQ